MGEYTCICACNLTFTERTSTFHPSLPRTAFIVAPIFFSQRRIGLHGKPFTMYKFRSMVTNAEELKKKLAEENGQTDRFIFKMKDDPRITKVGRFIRKTSLDEFPQFFNVLKGDMSLVGPRPALPEEVARYGSLYSTRLLVKPGITGPWQVSGRSDLSQEQSEYLDVSYIENWSIAGDLAILAKTVLVVFRGTGSYLNSAVLFARIVVQIRALPPGALFLYFRLVQAGDVFCVVEFVWSRPRCF